MKSQKKKVAFPRRTWQINPVTRGEISFQVEGWFGRKISLAKNHFYSVVNVATIGRWSDATPQFGIFGM
jgi:hypothetical protein